MINLMRNEFIKLFKKKSTYIILFLTIAFIIFSNFMYKNNNGSNYASYSKSMLTYYEETLSQLDPAKPSDLTMYLDTKAQVDMLHLIDRYGYTSWQANIIPEYFTPFIRTMNEYEYASPKDKASYEKAKKQYDTMVEKLDQNDWKYFVNINLDKINEQIQIQESIIENTVDKAALKSNYATLASLKVDKQVLEWRLEKNIDFSESFLNTALMKYSSYQNSVYGYEKSDNHTYSETLEYHQYLERANINKYYIENNVNIQNENDNRGILLNFFSNYELFILIFIIMVAGSIVSDEFSKGTIKLLLVRPYSRAKILLSKFTVCAITLVLFIIFVAGAQFLIGGIIQGFDTMDIPAIIYHHEHQQIETMNIFSYLLQMTITKLPIYFLLMTLAFACSTLFTNTAVAIVLPLLGYMASSIINQLALMYKIKPLLYFVTPNWDLSVYLFGGLPQFEGLTPMFSIAICIIYFVIMMIPTFLTFKKKNIKNI